MSEHFIDAGTRAVPVQNVTRFFDHAHLPDGKLKAVSRECADLAHYMLQMLPDDPELTVGLRKLLEAKDCFVRAAL